MKIPYTELEQVKAELETYKKDNDNLHKAYDKLWHVHVELVSSLRDIARRQLDMIDSDSDDD